jgi:hypothetical protein
VLKGFESKGHFDVDRATIARLIKAVVGFRGKALNANELMKDFGPQSSVAVSAIRVLYDSIQGTCDRTRVLYDDWRTAFSQVCAYSRHKSKGFKKHYAFAKGMADVEHLVFALHTYYALMTPIFGDMQSLGTS